jgi:hypothetical protein
MWFSGFTMSELWVERPHHWTICYSECTGYATETDFPRKAARMPRQISAAIEQLIQDEACQIAHLLTFSIGNNTYRYSEDDRVYLSESYTRGLNLLSPVRYSSQLRTDTVQIAIENVSLQMSALLTNVEVSIQGQEATLYRLFPQAMQALLLFRGRISEVSTAEDKAELTLITEFEPASTPLPLREYSALCSWNFADSNCGYVEGEDPLDTQTAAPFTSCPKDFTSCQARGRQHRFSGFLHLTRAVTENREA